MTLVKPGIAFFDILRHSADIGIASQSAEELYAIRKPYIDGAKASTYEETLSDGRIIVISHRPSALAALNMAMVLYEGKAIAFGSCQEIFARVSGGKPNQALSRPV